MSVTFKVQSKITYPFILSRNDKEIQLPVTKVFLNETELNFTLQEVSTKERQMLPSTSEAIIDYDGKKFSLGIYGNAFINCIQENVNWQTTVVCHGFADRLQSIKQKSSTCQGWFQSKLIYKGQIKSLEEFSKVWLYSKGEHVHSAFHVKKGIFISKIGSSCTYVISDFEVLRKLYNIDKIHITILQSICDNCKNNFDPKELQQCSKCEINTYCSIDCKQKHWSLHKVSCKKWFEQKLNPILYQNKLLQSYYNCRKDEIEKMLHCYCKGNIKIIEWFHNLLSICDKQSIPCTKLTELNQYFEDDKYKELIIKMTNYKLLVANLRQSVHCIVLNLSSSKVLNFEVLKEWNFETEYPVLLKGINMDKITYQAPYILRCAPSTHTGNFNRLDVNYGYNFTFND